MKIPSFQPSISVPQLNRAVYRALIRHKDRPDLEKALADYLGVKYAVGVPSGRWGLYYILKSLRLKPNDEVILPSFTYFAVPAVIARAGLKPVYVDLNPGDLGMDNEKLKKSITPKTRAVIATHLSGFVYRMEETAAICRKYGIILIEDCCQSLGAGYRDKKAGALGQAAYFTFGITKNFTTLGGGIVATDDPGMAGEIRRETALLPETGACALIAKAFQGYAMKGVTSGPIFAAAYYPLRIFSSCGIDIIDYIFREKGVVGCPGSLFNTAQADLGIKQLEELDKKNSERAAAGTEIYRRLQDLRTIRIPWLDKDGKNIFSTCPIMVKDRLSVKKKLLVSGVDVSAGYLQDCSPPGTSVQAAKVQNEVLYLPLYPGLTHSQLDCIVEAVKAATKDYSPLIR